ncbi:MAG: type II secretion system F family protein [Holosporaceae bacterium]|jgi:type II secretory pathway component PulF|nr:type II secretion system F family protein [Holosporaceae bacterium]
MSIYKYKVLTKDGSSKDGSILADNYKCAYDALRAKQYQPTEIKKVYFVSKKITSEDLLTFFMHINFQLKCGVGLNDAIESFVDFYGNKILNAALADVSDSLKRGESVGDAFGKYQFAFDDVVIGLLKSAENTGNTLDVIANILNFLKLQTDWKNNVKRAVAYPIFIAGVALLVLIMGVGILGPQVVSLIQNCNGGETPMLTQFAVNALPCISKVLVLFLATLIATWPILVGTKKGRRLLSHLILKIPKIGALVSKISLWQFCEILRIALAAKLDFMEALNIAVETIKFDEIKSELENIRNSVAEGYKISESFARANIIPAEILTAVYVGEEGNDLASSFKHINENWYREILFDIKSLGQILSAGLTIFTGLIFVFILCSLFYPIYSYVEIAGI